LKIDEIGVLYFVVLIVLEHNVIRPTIAMIQHFELIRFGIV